MKTIAAAGIAAWTTLAAGAAGAIPISGEFWDTGWLWNRAAADAAMSREADATFISSAIDYPNGSAQTVSDNRTTLSQYLGVDAASLSGEQDTRLTGSIFRFTGTFYLDGSDQTFEIASDDGFWLLIDGVEVTTYTRNRGFRSTTVTLDNLARGMHTYQLVYWENGGRTGVEARVNGSVFSTALAADPMAAVSLPASLPLLSGGLAGLAIRRRRRKDR